jgi:two-component system sensor histidine kinase KdpD
VYPPEKAERALQSFFKEPTLAALREMALRQTAHEVDARQAWPLSASAGAPVEAKERILIHVTPAPTTTALIRRGRRVADYLGGECFAVAILPPSRDGDRVAASEIEQHLAFARRLHVETRLLEADDPAKALVDFARAIGVTQIFVAKPARRRFRWLHGPEVEMRVVELAKDMQVTVVAERRPRGGAVQP